MLDAVLIYRRNNMTGFIGAGKVGTSLGKYFALNGLSVSGYFSRSSDSAKAAADFTESRCFENTQQLVKESDTILLFTGRSANMTLMERLSAIAAVHCRRRRFSAI